MQMKSIRLLTMTTALLAISSSNVFADHPKSLLDQGLDGTTRYFKLICSSGKRTNLSYDIETKETCVYPVNSNEQICKANWDKDKAAKEGCK